MMSGNKTHEQAVYKILPILVVKLRHSMWSSSKTANVTEKVGHCHGALRPANDDFGSAYQVHLFKDHIPIHSHTCNETCR